MITKIKKAFPIIHLALLLVELLRPAPIEAQELKSEGLKVDTVLTKILEEETYLSLFIANQLAISEQNPNLINSTRDSLHSYLKENKSIKVNTRDLEYFLDFKLEDQEPELVISKSISLSPKVQVELLELDINKGERLFLNYEKEKNIISLERIEILLNEIKVSNINKIKSGKPTIFEFTAEKSGKVKIILRSFGVLPQKGNLSVSITKNKPKLSLHKLTETSLRKEISPEMEKDTLIKSLFDEDVFLSGKIDPRRSTSLVKNFDLSSMEQILGIGLFFYPTVEKENLQIFRKDYIRQDPLEDFTLKELKGKSFTYLPEYTIETLELKLQDNSRNIIWTNSKNNFYSTWKKSPNSKSNYSFFTVDRELIPKGLTLTVANKTKLYDNQVSIKILVVVTQEFLVNKEKEIKEVEEKYVLTIL